MQKLLITGASGFFGWNLCRFFAQDREIWGVVNRHEIHLPNIRTVKADLTRYRELKAIFAETQPDAVIHAAAMSSANQCERYPEESRKINVDASVNLAGICSDRAIPLIFLSTDLVFDGQHPPYSEKDEPDPLNRYGEQKAGAEQEMIARYPEMTVARLPLMYGLRGPHSNNFFQDFLERMCSGEQLSLFTDEYRSTVDVNSAIYGVFLCLGKVAGVIHLGGKISLSRYEFGNILKEVFGIPNPGIRMAHQQDVLMAAARPADVTLDSSKAFGLGYDPLLPEAGVRRVREQMDTE